MYIQSTHAFHKLDSNIWDFIHTWFLWIMMSWSLSEMNTNHQLGDLAVAVDPLCRLIVHLILSILFLYLSD